MPLYKADFSNINIPSGDNFTLSVSFGDYLVDCNFRWPTVYQEQYDAFTREVERLPKSDPIIRNEGKEHDTSYDYIDYYVALRELTQNDIIEWVNNEKELPSSIKKIKNDEYRLVQTIMNRITLCETLDKYRLLFKEIGVWLVTMTWEGDTRTARIIPGGWSHNQDNSFRFRFTSEKETIGKDDLSYITFEVETNG